MALKECLVQEVNISKCTYQQFSMGYLKKKCLGPNFSVYFYWVQYKKIYKPVSNCVNGELGVLVVFALHGPVHVGQLHLESPCTLWKC